MRRHPRLGSLPQRPAPHYVTLLRQPSPSAGCFRDGSIRTRSALLRLGQVQGWGHLTESCDVHQHATGLQKKSVSLEIVDLKCSNQHGAAKGLHCRGWPVFVARTVCSIGTLASKSVAEQTLNDVWPLAVVV